MMTYALEIPFPPGASNYNLRGAAELSRRPNTFSGGETICTSLAGHRSNY